MREQFEGQCQCGRLKYRVTGIPVTLFVCHCTDCQRQSSSAFGMALWIRDPEVSLSGGELKEWIRKLPSGKEMACRFCPECGTRIFHQVLGQSQFMSIKPGTLKDTGHLKPAGHIWTSRKQSWLSISDASLQYEKNPPDFEALFSAGSGH